MRSPIGKSARRSSARAAAAVALQAVGEADVVGVSMRRLATVLESESVGCGASVS